MWMYMVGKGMGQEKNPCWNLLCVRYYARFIHIVLSSLLGVEVGGLGGSGGQYIYTLYACMLLRFFTQKDNS